MKTYVINTYSQIKSGITNIFVTLVLIWTLSAVTFQISMVYLDATSNEEVIQQINSWFTKTFDGNFSKPQVNKVHVQSVTNKVVIGPIVGNRNLEFGVKNVIEEVLQDKNYELDTSANLKLSAQIVYLDVLKTQSSLSVLHKNKESVVIRLQGQLFENNKLKKKAIVEESADEISMSTLLIDQGGKFNQQNLSSALKKASESLVNKLLQ